MPEVTELGAEAAWTSTSVPHFCPEIVAQRLTDTWLERCFVWPTLFLKRSEIGHKHLLMGRFTPH